MKVMYFAWLREKTAVSSEDVDAGGLETEQTLRAEALAAKGALQVVPEDDLSSARLSAAIDRALASPPSSAAGVDINGAAKTSALVKALAGAG